MSDRPPETIFYADTGGKSAPFYRTLAGIKSALKTSWRARWAPERTRETKVWKGTVTWEEISVD